MTESNHPYVRPGALITRIANPVLRHLRWTPALVVSGRKSGKRLVTPMGAPLELNGRSYLVSGRGTTDWVRNLRAAGHAAFRFHGATRPFRAVEITGPERDEIVTAYRARLGHSVDPYFDAIPDPSDHPVFLMEPENVQTESPTAAR